MDSPARALSVPALLASLALLAPLRAAQEPPPPPPPPPVTVTGTVTGTVLDANAFAVDGAGVVLCDAARGQPLSRRSYRPVIEDLDDAQGAFERTAMAVTGEDGAFAFRGVPAGEYRIVAQSWTAAESVKSPLGKNGVEVRLRGVVEGVVVVGGGETAVQVLPLGDLTLSIDVDSGNSDTVLVISRNPTRADPILGFSGWGGSFMAGMIGANRMPKGLTTFRGLPAGRLHVAVFAPDNMPGWGAAAVELEPRTVTHLDLRFVASWSDGVHSPPPELEPLMLHLRELQLDSPESVLKLLALEGIELGAERHPLESMGWLSAHLERPLTLTDGSVHSVAAVLAAAGYSQMARTFEQQGRVRNPYRPPGVERRPLE